MSNHESNEQISSAIIEVDGHQFPISGVNQFGFTAPPELSNLPLKPRQAAMLLLSNGQDRLPPMNVVVRIRKSNQQEVSCSFCDMSITDQSTIKTWQRRRDRGNQSASLSSRSYDELARGDSSSESSVSATPEPAPARKNYVKSLVLLGLVLGIVGMAILAAAFLRSRSTLGVTNAALIGNYVPVNARINGEVTEVLFEEGQLVRQGDVLLRMKNSTVQLFRDQCIAEMEGAQAKVIALKKRIGGYDAKTRFASIKLDLEVEALKAELKHAASNLKAAEAQIERIKPFRESGAVTEIEFQESTALRDACIAERDSKEILIRKTQLAKDAAKQNILLMGDRIDDELARITSEYEIAHAELMQLTKLSKLAAEQIKDLDIVAPRDGRVYAIYPQVGEFLKIADQAVAISYPGKSWAAGQVTAHQVSRVRPGQPVAVSIPSLNLKLEGHVAAVGHRAVYSRGNYSADFRGETATDVPIKVTIPDLPDDIPSGLRLDMAVKIGFGVPWLDDMMGSTHRDDVFEKIYSGGNENAGEVLSADEVQAKHEPNNSETSNAKTLPASTPAISETVADTSAVANTTSVSRTAVATGIGRD